jgi:hypothetical protein
MNLTFSILESDCVHKDKRGAPVRIEGTVSDADLYDLTAWGLTHHIVIASFREAYRCSAFWLGCDMMAMDFEDEHTTADQIHNQLVALNYNHAIIGSTNHLKFKNDGTGVRERFHVFIPFTKRVTVKEDYKEIVRYFIRQQKWVVDMAASCDVCRYYFKHSIALHIYEDGRDFPIEDYKEFVEIHRRMREEKAKDAAERSKQFAHIPAIKQFERTKHFRILRRGFSGEGCYSLRCSVIGAMKTCGLTNGEAHDMFVKYNAYGGKFERRNLDSLFG